MENEEVGHRYYTRAALRKTLDGTSREVLRVAHLEMETVKMRLDDDPDDSLYRKDQCRDHLICVTSKEGPLDLQYEDIIIQYLQPEYDIVCQTHFEGKDFNLADIRRMMSRI